MNLLDLSPTALRRWCTELGEKQFRAKQLMRWIHHAGEDDFAAMSNLPSSLRDELAIRAHVGAPALINEHISADGSRKFLFDVGNGNVVESVFIPEGGRVTMCISTQVGCALECSFCSTGKEGFNRNLSTAEIIGQLWQARRFLRRATMIADKNSQTDSTRLISNVVLMGMGEPLANMNAVVAALQLMLDDNAYGLSRRRVTVSTSGLVPAIDRLSVECPVALAVSLHAPNDALRNKLVPLNRKYPLAALLDACNRYLKHAPRDFVTFEYVMLDGLNDSPAMARQLLDIARRVPCKFNLIPFNPFPGSIYRRPPPERIRRFASQLAEAGYVATIRKTRGEDIDAACGQLAGQVQERRKKIATANRVDAQAAPSRILLDYDAGLTGCRARAVHHFSEVTK